MAYSLIASGCSINYNNGTTVSVKKCPVTLTIQQEILPTRHSESIDCQSSDTCHFDVYSPVLKKWTYLAIVLDPQAENVTGVTLNLDFTVKSKYI